jgi:hypothetical protein
MASAQSTHESFGGTRRAVLGSPANIRDWRGRKCKQTNISHTSLFQNSSSPSHKLASANASLQRDDERQPHPAHQYHSSQFEKRWESCQEATSLHGHTATASLEPDYGHDLL